MKSQIYSGLGRELWYSTARIYPLQTLLDRDLAKMETRESALSLASCALRTLSFSPVSPKTKSNQTKPNTSHHQILSKADSLFHLDINRSFCSHLIFPISPQIQNRSSQHLSIMSCSDSFESTPVYVYVVLPRALNQVRIVSLRK